MKIEKTKKKTSNWLSAMFQEPIARTFPLIVSVCEFMAPTIKCSSRSSSTAGILWPKLGKRKLERAWGVQGGSMATTVTKGEGSASAACYKKFNYKNFIMVFAWPQLQCTFFFQNLFLSDVTHLRYEDMILVNAKYATIQNSQVRDWFWYSALAIPQLFPRETYQFSLIAQNKR